MRTKKIAIALLALGALLVPAAAASAAPAAPAWQLSLIPLPTNFAPGSVGNTGEAPLYRLTATNVGGAPTNAPITFSATLPVGLTPVGLAGDDYNFSAVANPSCSAAGQTVTCTAAGPFYPGRWLGAKIPVEVTSPPGGALPPAEATISGGGAATVTTTSPVEVSSQARPFGFLPGPAGAGTLLTNADGAPATGAGSHPDQLTVNLAAATENPEGSTIGAGHPHDIVTDLPRGLIVDPSATSVRCTEAQLIFNNNQNQEGKCPPASQVGTVAITTEISGPTLFTDPIYNMVPPPGAPAELGFEAVPGIFVHLEGGVRSDGDYGLTATSHDTLARSLNPLLSAQVQLWGDPSGSSHDEIRGGKCLEAFGIDFCPVDPSEKTGDALLAMPSQCTGPITTTLSADSWEEPGVFVSRSVQSVDIEGNPVGVDGCNAEEFTPTISAKPTTNLADSPSGLDFDLHQPQDQRLGHTAPAELRDATVTLPEGMAVNPSQADGLAACTEEQIGYLAKDEEAGIHFSKDPDNCPDAAQLGTVQVKTPLLAEYEDEGTKLATDPETGAPIPRTLPGSLYIAKPFENPFGSLLAIYLVIDDPASGTVAKLAGKVEPDPITGQLTTRFAENPELPLQDVALHLFGGARASLITPQLCGTHTTTSALTPWSSPEGIDAHPADSFATSAEPGGGACPTAADAASNNPAFGAGTILPQAAAYTPFVLKLSRNDGSQRLAGIDATLPPGLAARFAGVAECSDAQIAQAKAREKPNLGILEQQSPSCPSSSQVGTVDVAAGAGPTPFHTQGKAYLAGPYKGAPLSMVIITPALAGPFDLGAVVVRTALYVDPATAQGRAVSDPLPQILDGIPLDVRSIEVKLDRSQFTLNPTSCDPLRVLATATSALGGAAALGSPFQVGGCSSLPFKPKLALRLKGGTKRADHPKLIATLKAKPGEANIARAQVKLPPSAFLDQAHIRTVCTRVQFAANACPAGSIYGTATATTPLLDQPLSGNVYLRSSNHKLPDLLVALKGPASLPIEIDLDGRTDSVKGALRNTFEAVPDAPVSKFRLELFGGKRGLVVNSRDLCAHQYRAAVALDGQNDKTYETTPAVGTDCKQKKRRRAGGNAR
jgi:hypothetical protein